ncbi:two-component system response regulator CreB [Oleiharenicola lentus]|uniref:two-component system response regulator CreB n=1 Tax=Oleiharenicola lentus TaxID=2508720 RepID=UPI003F6737AF
MLPARPGILVVEDEASIAETLVYALQTEGFAPTWKSTGRDALEFLKQPDSGVVLVVLDVGLPDMSGFDVCRELQRTAAVPVIFLTARSGEVDKIVGLELGADDYMAKPFSPRELTARVRAVLRRSKGNGGAATAPAPATPVRDSGRRPQVSTWVHDDAKCRISYHGQALDLTRNEYRLLAALLASPGRVFNRDQLMTAAWDDPGAALDRTVDAHVKMVRAKLREIAPDADPIVTHRGLGYSLREDE